MAASSDRLGGLHEMFTAYWEARMRQMTEGVEDEETGKIVRIPLSAAELAVLRAFLKDNNVTADPADDKGLKDLAGELAAATKGVVAQSELDDIMANFTSAMPGFGNMQ